MVQKNRITDRGSWLSEILSSLPGFIGYEYLQMPQIQFSVSTKYAG